MRVPANHQNARIYRERDMRALSRLALLLFSGLVLCGGFVFAARQHFAAVKYGYNSEELRIERERLLREKQQLLLERERASSPARLESAARLLGLKPLMANQVGMRKPKAVAKSPTPEQQAKKSASAGRQH